MKVQHIMAVGAHADDIEILAGGTLAKYHAQGYQIDYIMSTNNMSGGVSTLNTDGTITTRREGPVEMMARRKGECDSAAALLGTTPIHLDHAQRHYWSMSEERSVELRYGCDLPDGVPPNVPSIMTAYEDAASRQRLVDLILEKDPTCIFTHSLATYDIEHTGTCFLVTQAYWQAVEQGFRGALLYCSEDFTGHGPSNAQWDTHVDISDWLDRKIELIGKHACQMPTVNRPDHGHRLRPMKWGVASGCKAAEVFRWVSRGRHIDRDSREGTYTPLITELTQNSR